MHFKLFAIFAVVMFAFPGVTATQTQKTPKKPAAQRVTYACPMHPDVTSTRRGSCRKCGMELRPAAKETELAAGAVSQEPTVLSTFTSRRIPNARLYDQTGKQLHFYDDLIKGKTVAINFIFTTCTASCPPLTATFKKVQQDAAQRGLEVQLISISVDPTVDTPERLQAFAQKFNAGPGWTFVTGDKVEIGAVLKGLGAPVTDKNDHTPMIMIGNDAFDYWTRAYGLSSPTKLVDLIADAVSHK
jgi:cytochrome oxidase Cu insertion factor (SCO1/SenC/PrrC family)